LGEVQELYNIALSITQKPSINIVIDNKKPTACTDYKTIWVTKQLAPKELWRLSHVMSRIFDGQVVHEAGHIIITTPVKEACVKWEKQQENSKLANLVHQSLEDKRVNHFCLSRYRFDFAHRLQFLADTNNRSWVDTLKARLLNEKAIDAVRGSPTAEAKFIDQMLIPLASLKAQWNWDVEKDFPLNEEQKMFVQKTARIFDDARFDRMVMSVVNRHQELYDLWQERIDKTKEEPEKGIPKSQGGDMELHSGDETRKALKELEKELTEAEEQAEAEAEEKDKDDSPKSAAGKGDGLKIPTPTPNEEEYQKLAQRNRPHIEELLNLLKKLAMPKLMTEKWGRQGRFMTEVLGKAYASSTARNVQGMYARRTVQLEKAEACIGLIVDLSGSVNIEDAKDALTTISEVCGRWLRDEDFAIMVFGSDYQKIKAYVEPYHTTRARIGGVDCMDGTELLAPLHELYQMMMSQRNSRAKILMIVSDFYVDKEDECKELIENIQHDGISVIGLGIDSSKEEYVKQFCAKAKYIGSITELPDAVFTLYREVAF
jgi:broad specificity phosphatase PhoE